jgi:hypothetical protein
MLNRRLLLRGMFAMPAVVAASSLMPIRSVIVPTFVTETAIIHGGVVITGRLYNVEEMYARLDTYMKKVLWRGDELGDA